ncbi:N-acetylglucosamine-6-phosphate deacetylase [Caldalkalibacillus uzonensis]|uniref:N-acetylglucosamine-6-phosphate deacetylase n=1 Tax=Caldalkalibacillus uzonensis TaxID=353224 RepID=A0ABU0CQ70_9BACI|nr:amidohydrolase family protein [Caldalkalibacillus uzonensis]MDQ0338563.1 N-acetylglucosamine-6-phosphate deacetylase [Caldalkalibacillus uzonensis]
MASSHEGCVIEGLHYGTKKKISIHVRKGKIHQIECKGPAEADERTPMPLIGPGLVDLQINGYRQFDFNTVPLSMERMMNFTRSLWREGVTSYCPTIITNSNEAIEEALKVILASCTRDPVMDQAIQGIHLEGPFISPEDGPRGAHPRKHVKAPDWQLFLRWQNIAQGRIKIITLSPEWENAPDFISNCVQYGVKVAIGHTAATPEQIRYAVAAGATMSTHLGNGAHVKLSRHPNYIWEQLAQDDLWCTLIADGFHLPDSVLKVMLRVKGTKAILVSDSVSLSGMPPGVYETHVGGKVVLTPEGKLHLVHDPNLLAGSVQMLLKGMEHMVRLGLVSLKEAWEMCSVRPFQFLNPSGIYGLKIGAPADIILLEEEKGTYRVVKTYKNGELVYEHPSTGENKERIVISFREEVTYEGSNQSRR